ncbi:hypothetical protein DFH09DRAFT_1084461 [Mycena vulgaris]|nr:hypothetical protein DFH09DRAFT_1084461 [Mycena vulgaris]
MCAFGVRTRSDAFRKILWDAKAEPEPGVRSVRFRFEPISEPNLATTTPERELPLFFTMVPFLWLGAENKGVSRSCEQPPDTERIEDAWSTRRRAAHRGIRGGMLSVRTHRAGLGAPGAAECGGVRLHIGHIGSVGGGHDRVLFISPVYKPVYKPVLKWSGQNDRFLIISGVITVGNQRIFTPVLCRAPVVMSLSGLSYYDKELKHSICLLKALPESIPMRSPQFHGLVPNAVDDDEDDNPPAGAVSQTTLNVLLDGVDIWLPFFRDLLADKPIEGADAIRSLANWSEDVVGGVQGDRKAAGKKIWDGEVEKLVF